MNGFFQNDPNISRKQAFAQALLQQGLGQSGPISSPYQSLAKVLSAGLGSYLGNKATQEEQDFRKQQQEKLAQTLGGIGLEYPTAQNEQGQTVRAEGPPNQSDIGKLVATLAGTNPELATQLAVQDINRQSTQRAQDQQFNRQLQQQSQLSKQRYQDQLNLAEEKAKLAQEYPSPPSPLEAQLKQLKIENEQQKVLKAQQEVAEKNRNLSKNEESRQLTATLAESLLRRPQALAATYGRSSFLPTFDPETAAFQADRDTLVSNETLTNIDKLTGVLSDTDIALLKSSVSKLQNEGISEESAREELKRIYKKLTGKDFTDKGSENNQTNTNQTDLSQKYPGFSTVD